MFCILLLRTSLLTRYLAFRVSTPYLTRITFDISMSQFTGPRSLHMRVGKQPVLLLCLK